jgi:putative endonuclease
MFWNRRKLLADRKLLGKWGEKRCERFLSRKGFKTLDRNFLCKAGEIDLIMVAPDHSLVFVEVRTKTDEVYASVESSITKPKKTRLLRTARFFLKIHNIHDRPFRFDVVTIVLSQKDPVQIRHYENAFGP